MADQRRDPDQRPSPEALLEAARREEGRVGKLRIFVGAAPGVGKTYEMLQQARAKRRDGADVIAGVVETHGRKETEALLEGLPIVPRKSVAYRGQTIDEMDLDAVIARHPKIVLVDERNAGVGSGQEGELLSLRRKRETPVAGDLRGCDSRCVAGRNIVIPE